MTSLRRRTHKCIPRSREDGRSAADDICKAGVCVLAQDRRQDHGRHRDDPRTQLTGCSLDYRFICVSVDCTPVDECNGPATCSDGASAARTPLGSYPVRPERYDTVHRRQLLTAVTDRCKNEGEGCDTGDRDDGDGCDHNFGDGMRARRLDPHCSSDDVCPANGACNAIWGARRSSRRWPAEHDTGRTAAPATAFPSCGDGVTALGVESARRQPEQRGIAPTAACRAANAATDCKTCRRMRSPSVPNLCSLGRTAKENQACSTGGSGTCHSGACTAEPAGTGRSTGRAVRLGPNTTWRERLRPDLPYSCQTSMDCDDGDLCNGTETCVAVPATAGPRARSARPAPRSDGDVCAASPGGSV